MRRITFIILAFLAFSCHKAPLSTGHYFGIIKDGDKRYRFALDYTTKKPVLTLISFRGYKIPLKKYEFKNDSVFFERAGENASYKGLFSSTDNIIYGEWTSDDSVKFPLIFLPAKLDTIKGLNPRTTSSYRYKSPPLENDGLRVCQLSQVKINPSRIDSLVHAIMKKKFGYTHSLLISRNNQLAVEEYFFEYKREAHFGIQSVTKSFVSALTGIAIANGEIKNTNTPVCAFLPKYQDLTCNPQNKNITIHDMMTMSTGLAWDEIRFAYGHPKNSSMIASESPDAFRYLFSRPRSSKKIFAYNSYNHSLMSHVLKESTKLSNVEEYNQRLIQPLGITSYDLGEPEDGIVGDIFLRPRDMMKFGLMYLNDGVYNGKQIVPSKWVRESTTPKIIIEDDLGYGYFWWTKKFNYKNQKIDTYFAWGYGGQYIFVIPSLKVVVVLNGTNWSTDLKKYYFEMMEDFILPAIE
jgi:CubicO group peptidase (beta-lactamase class C family)